MQHFPPGQEPTDLAPFLGATVYLDADAPAVQRFARAAVGDAADEREKAVRLYYRVRDGFLYDPFSMKLTAEAHMASTVAAGGAAYCIPKAVLLAAAARAVGIPAGIGLADVTNHLTTEKLTRAMGGSTLFVDHGFAVLRVGGKWLKAAPAFNIELCERFGVKPTEFDGASDAILQEFDAKGRRHMEYVAHHGTYSDLPFAKIVADFEKEYGGSDMMRSALSDTASSETF